MPHILITGGSQRLGLTLVTHFLSKGWQVSVLTRQSSDDLDALKCDQLALLKLGDYSIEAIESACYSLANQPLDTIIHNASLFEMDAEEPLEANRQLQRLMNIHVNIPAHINSRLIGTLQQSNNANIIQMTDIYAENPNEQYAHYCASKAAAQNMALSLAKKLAPKIRVNCIAPGALKFLPSHSEDAKKQVLSASLIPHEAGFEPIIETVDYLLRNTFVTGTTLKVDGGRSLCR